MSSHSQETIERFIALRAQGATFTGIAAEIGVAKSTLILWSRKYHNQIHNLRVLEAEALAEKCKISRQDCLEDLGRDIARLRAELQKRDLSDVSTSRLFALAILLRAEALRLNPSLQFTEEIPDDSPDLPEFTNPTVTWEA